MIPANSPFIAWVRFFSHLLLVLILFRSWHHTAMFRFNSLPQQILRGVFLFGSTVFDFAALRTLQLAETTSIFFFAPMVITALAGPLSNVVLALLFVLPLRLLHAAPVGFADVLVTQMIFVNLLLAAFNMIPVPPLDGLKILNGVLPPFWYQFTAPMERYGFIVLFAVIIIGGQAGAEVIRAMYVPVYDLLHSAIVGPLPL